ncbi:hypothetical protein [Micromonospora qiuiae]|uniref:hypothetical protein n=1 Tax=Micromonospora qiuiae TaxID=502268 RepID=UPI00194E3D2F|nr:hypothetical protein [Micromonospora qiuiae]
MIRPGPSPDRARRSADAGFAIAGSDFEAGNSTALLTDRPWRLLTRTVPKAPTGS